MNHFARSLCVFQLMQHISCPGMHSIDIDVTCMYCGVILVLKMILLLGEKDFGQLFVRSLA